MVWVFYFNGASAILCLLPLVQCYKMPSISLDCMPGAGTVDRVGVAPACDASPAPGLYDVLDALVLRVFAAGSPRF